MTMESHLCPTFSGELSSRRSAHLVNVLPRYGGWPNSHGSLEHCQHGAPADPKPGLGEVLQAYKLYLAGLPRLQSIASVLHCWGSALADESHTSPAYPLGSLAVHTAAVKLTLSTRHPGRSYRGFRPDTSGTPPN